MIKSISHIGIAVKDLESATKIYECIFGLEVSPPIESPNLRVSMIKVGDSHIELLQPTTKEGEVAKFIEKRGEGIQHICLEVDDIEKELESFTMKGLQVIGKHPSKGVEGLIAFLHPKQTNGVLIELVQKI